MDYFYKIEQLSKDFLTEGGPLLLTPMHMVCGEDTSCPSLILDPIYL